MITKYLKVTALAATMLMVQGVMASDLHHRQRIQPHSLRIQMKLGIHRSF